jgi:hypothetical protein
MNGMIDYRCNTCGYRFEHFFHNREEAPETQPCTGLVDGTTIDTDTGVSSSTQVNCNGTATKYSSVPGEYRPSNAQRFDPIVIWQSDTDPNKFSFPGRSNEPCDPGYHAITIRNMHEAQKWTKHINQVYALEKDIDRERDRIMFNERLQENRRDRAAKVRGNARLEAFNRLMIERQDRKRANKYDHGRSNVNFHMNVLEFDSSNRMDHCDADTTGWKSRKA